VTISTHTEPVAYPFNSAEGLELADRYTEIREGAGLIRVRMPHGEPAWLATRYADARLVLGDRRFSRAVAPEHDEPRLGPASQSEGMISMDPPEHSRLRTLVAKAFTQRRVEQLRPRARELAEELAGAMLAQGPPVDLVESFALPLPVAVICELLGVPELDRPRFRVWSDAVMSTARLTEEQFQTYRDEFRDYLRHLIALRRAEPADDLMTALIEARDERDRLSELELVDLCGGILVAGHETTATQIPNFVYTLLNHPDLLAELRADPGLIPAAVEELTRYVALGAASVFPRYATEDVEVGGVLVRAGEAVLVSVQAANRDVQRFEDPEEIRFDREENPHIGFGHGAHHCLGAQLARMELQEALRVLLSRFPGLHVAGDVVWKTQMLVRGPQTMPVAW
jgi:cytochrome P450